MSKHDTPEYLRGVRGLSKRDARLAELSDEIPLSRAEEQRLQRAIERASVRVRLAREVWIWGTPARGEVA